MWGGAANPLPRRERVRPGNQVCGLVRVLPWLKRDAVQESYGAEGLHPYDAPAIFGRE